MLTFFVRLYTDLVTDSLAEFAYDAELAGLEYSFASHSLGLFVTLNGYNDKLSVLARHVLEKVKNIKVVPERLEIAKEQVGLKIVVYVGWDGLILRIRSNEIGKISSLVDRTEFRIISPAIF